MTDQNPPAAWHPVPEDPNTERFWDGNGWSDQYRPRNVAPAPAPPSQQFAAAPVPGPNPPSKKSGCFGIGVGVMFGIIGAFVLLVGGCVAVITASANEVVKELEAADEIIVDGVASDPTSTDEEDPLGSRTNPLAFGTPHTRQPGLGGAGWTISIDEVREIEVSSFYDGTGTCVAVIGTATLDSLRDDQVASDMFSFPAIELVDARGVALDSLALECDSDVLKGEGLLWRLDVEITEGSTVGWFETFLLPSGDYDFVAVEETIYKN